MQSEQQYSYTTIYISPTYYVRKKSPMRFECIIHLYVYFSMSSGKPLNLLFMSDEIQQNRIHLALVALFSLARKTSVVLFVIKLYPCYVHAIWSPKKPFLLQHEILGFGTCIDFVVFFFLRTKSNPNPTDVYNFITF